MSHNMFAYCANNPINREDPSGRWSISSLKKAVNNFILEASIFVYVNIRVAQTIISNKIMDGISKVFNTGGSTPQIEQNAEEIVTKVSNYGPKNLPKNPEKLVEGGWKDVTHEQMAKNTSSRDFLNPIDGMKVRFDARRPGAPGFEGMDHYHIYNPNSTGKVDYYFDINWDTVAKGSKASHILPGD